MVASDSWREDLEARPTPFLADLMHPAQRRMCPTDVAGLIGAGDRKSIQPLAARTDDGAIEAGVSFDAVAAKLVVGHEYLADMIRASYLAPLIVEAIVTAAACGADPQADRNDEPHPA